MEIHPGVGPQSEELSRPAPFLPEVDRFLEAQPVGPQRRVELRSRREVRLAAEGLPSEWPESRLQASRELRPRPGQVRQEELTPR